MTDRIASALQTIQRLNALPPSQHARKMLLTAAAVPNDGGLYLMQLAERAVEHGCDSGRYLRLRETLNRLREIAAWSPEQVYRAMTQDDAGDASTGMFLATTTLQDAQDALLVLLI